MAPSYAIAIAYVLGDTYDKTLKAYISQVSAHPCAGVGTVTGTDSKEEKLSRINYSKIAIESGDTLLWQMLASVTIPGKNHIPSSEKSDLYDDLYLATSCCHSDLPL